MSRLDEAEELYQKFRDQPFALEVDESGIGTRLVIASNGQAVKPGVAIFKLSQLHDYVSIQRISEIDPNYHGDECFVALCDPSNKTPITILGSQMFYIMGQYEQQLKELQESEDFAEYCKWADRGPSEECVLIQCYWKRYSTNQDFTNLIRGYDLRGKMQSQFYR